jgi:hypothetical protein
MASTADDPNIGKLARTAIGKLLYVVSLKMVGVDKSLLLA